MDKKIYLKVFLVTLAIFLLVLWASNWMSQSRLQELKQLESQISLSILSTETRFSLLEKTVCDNLVSSEEAKVGFNDELVSLARKLKFMENQLGSDNEDVLSIKEYYVLLQIKDYLLEKEFQTRCKDKTVSILYFFDAKCDDCAKQSIVLDGVSEKYPKIRVYWIDKDVNTPALNTMLSLFKIKEAPALVINDKLHSGFQSLEDIEGFIPETKAWREELGESSTSEEE